MKIDFKKVGFNKKEIKIEQRSLFLYGICQKESKSLASFLGKLQGVTTVMCIQCGREYEIEVNEPLHLKLSDGIYKGFDEEADVIEFYDGFIDFEAIIDSENESIKLEYHICQECKEKEK